MAGFPVVEVLSGGVPATDTPNGPPVTAGNKGLAIRWVPSGGIPLNRGIINVFLNSAAALSMRIPAGSGYTGPLVRVKRSTDNAETAIGAVAEVDANGDRWLDENALLNWIGVPRYPLDLVAGAATAFSLRKVRSAYTGPAIKVWRSSDNAELDVGFTANGDLDTVALLAFVGAGDGFVTTWYDQSGNARHATHSNPAEQGRIVNAGVYGGEIDFAASSTANRGRLFFPSTLTLSAYPYTTNAVMRKTATNPSILFGNTQSTIQFFRVDGLTSAQLVPGLSYGSAFNASVPVVLTQTMQAGNAATGWANGTNVGSTTTAAGTGLSTQGIGIWGGPQSFFAAKEMFIFPSALSALDRLLLEQSQAAYYGITYATALPSASVTTWYDQSGNGRNAVQATPANQPRIVNAGVVNLKNGRPSLSFSGSNWLIGAAALNAQQAFMVQATNSTAFSFEYSCGSIVPSLAAIRSDASFRRAGRAGTTNQLGQFIDAADLGVMRQYTDSIETSGSAMRRNGTDINRDSVVSSTQGNLLTIGSRDGVTASIVADISELVFFQSVLAAPDRQALERNQGTAFGITVA